VRRLTQRGSLTFLINQFIEMKYLLFAWFLAGSVSSFAQKLGNDQKYDWDERIVNEASKLGSNYVISNDRILEWKGKLQPFIFLKDSTKLLFFIQEKEVPALPKPSVDVYSYTDVKLQDEQLRDFAIKRKYAVLFDYKTGTLTRLENEGEKLVADYFGRLYNIQLNDDYLLLFKFASDIFTYEDGVINEGYSMAQYTWNKGLNCDLYIVSLKDGKRLLVKKDLQPAYRGEFADVKFSDDAKQVRYREGSNLYAYNIATAKTVLEKAGVKDELPKYVPQKLQAKDSIILSEEITWTTFDGRPGRGVLAKPKDFDPNKKYPIIFIYYQQAVVLLNENKPYGIGDFVDYGYLVFSPDIEYTIGETGNSVYNYVVSAAEYMSRKPYVDAKRMGIKGASFGGYETNYLVTHSNLFAAAISCSGYSDFISNTGSMNNWIRPHGLEGTDQNNLGVTMWQRPDIWIKNSPLFYADRVTAPLLLIHSKSDFNVPFEQSLAFFRALRSLGRKSWLLQYDDQGHMAVISSMVGKPYLDCDLCTRQLQFFNHYLKGEPAPLWMLDGIPAREKGKKLGLELDTLGRTPGPGLRREKLILNADQEQLLKHKTMVTEDGRVIDVIDNKKEVKNAMKKTNF
jgi:dipeptidyl aminopeptidase/acylaminoacyl peptidase